jgi:hypothetical protein
MNATIDLPLGQGTHAGNSSPICVETADYAIRQLVKVAKEHPSPETSVEDCRAFSGQVFLVEGMIEATFGVALQHVREEPNPELIASIWRAVDGLCHRALVVLSSLKDQFPKCGTPETHDRVLDLKSEVISKLSRVDSEIKCQHLIPDSLFQ